MSRVIDFLSRLGDKTGALGGVISVMGCASCFLAVASIGAALGMTGPVVVLLSVYSWFLYGWSTETLYAGLVLMLVVAVWDMVSPANRRCNDGTCDAAARQ